jgi:two-component system nitrogen regulation response regulator GlnG/two-component system response regulator HydG
LPGFNGYLFQILKKYNPGLLKSMAQTVPKKTILFVSLNALSKAMDNPGSVLSDFRLLEARSAAQALSLLEREKTDIVFLDIQAMPAQEMDLVHYIKSRSPHTEVVILATMNDLESATKALRNGASFYLIKPVRPADIKAAADKLSVKVDNLAEYRELEQRLLTDLMAGSPSMQKVLKLAMKIAPTSSTVLVCGESGTGKEFFARIIHHMSRRTDGKFVAMNCGAIPDTLFESELFGHVKGSFTGADRDREGLVEEAHLGTLFLDEVAELTPSAQVKLLRFLQERTFKRIGENVQRTVNVRIIAASNKDLQSLVLEKKFREDLFYRLNVFCLNLPPLRDRKETIPNLIKLFIHRNNDLLDKHVSKLSPAAEAALANYEYPGNVRELENIIEHAMVLADSNEISDKDLPEFMFKNHLLLAAPQGAQGASAGECLKLVTSESVLTLADLERQYIARALDVHKSNYSETARKLGISRSTLWRKVREYGLEKKEQ